MKLQTLLAIVSLGAGLGAAGLNLFRIVRPKSTASSDPRISQISRWLTPFADRTGRAIQVDEILALRPGRAVLLISSGGSDIRIAKIFASQEGSPSLLLNAYRESAVLTWLGGRSAPAFKGVSTNQDGSVVMVESEKVEGATLLEAIRRSSRPPTFAEVRDSVAAICTAIISLHDQGVVHGDLKPSNLMAAWMPDPTVGLTIVPKSPVTVIDFESAESLDTALGSLETIRGTLGFTAPERFWRYIGKPTADVYSCGSIASFLLTGLPRRPGSTARERIPQSLVRSLVLQATDVDPSIRPQSVHDFLDLWLAAFEDETAQESIDSPVMWPQSQAWKEAILRLDHATVRGSDMHNPIGDILEDESTTFAEELVEGLTPIQREFVNTLATRRSVDRDMTHAQLQELARLHRSLELRMVERFASPSIAGELSSVVGGHSENDLSSDSD